jgi:hypothetical protein
MSRSINEVIQKVVQLLPADLPNVEAISNRLDDIAASAVYKAPEQMWLVWRELCDYLTAALPYPDTSAPEWAQRIGRIVRDEEK